MQHRGRKCRQGRKCNIKVAENEMLCREPEISAVIFSYS